MDIGKRIRIGTLSNAIQLPNLAGKLRKLRTDHFSHRESVGMRKCPIAFGKLPFVEWLVGGT